MAKQNTYDIVVGNKTVKDVSMKPIFVPNETERDKLKNVPPGAFVFLEGLDAVWQRTAAGGWKTVYDARS